MDENMITFESGVNTEGKPFIHVKWGPMMAQLTPEEAVKHGLGVIETAQGALTDAFFVTFIRDRMGIPVERSWPLLVDFRQFREARVSTYRPPDEEAKS